jgi:hypothetical protein
MSNPRGLYQVPDEPEPPPLQGSVSAPVSALGKASAPLRECPFCGGEPTEVMSELGSTVISCHRRDCNITAFTSAWTHREEAVKAWNRRDGEAARVAEARAEGAAAERERIVKMLEIAQDRLQAAIAGTQTVAQVKQIGTSWSSLQVAIDIIEKGVAP